MLCQMEVTAYLMYIFQSFQSPLPWSSCPHHFGENGSYVTVPECEVSQEVIHVVNSTATTWIALYDTNQHYGLLEMNFFGLLIVQCKIVTNFLKFLNVASSLFPTVIIFCQAFCFSSLSKKDRHPISLHRGSGDA